MRIRHFGRQFTLFIIAVLPITHSVSSEAQGLHFGIVAKSVDDVNFIAAWRGCEEEALKTNDSCYLLGGEGAANPRLQLKSIQDYLQLHHLDALIISVTNSAYIAEGIKELDIPVYTFDSPFAFAEKKSSRAYIGVDNYQFGEDLARLAKQLRPEGGTICLMTAKNDPNLAQRILGVRRMLSGNEYYPQGRRLNQDGGWTESIRCPWYSGDNLSRSLDQLEVTLNQLKPDVFLSVGSWPLADVTAYRRTIAAHQKILLNMETLVFFGFGKILPEHEQLLDEHLLHGIVSIDFPTIGRKIVEVVRADLNGERIESRYYVPATLRLVGDEPE